MGILMGKQKAAENAKKEEQQKKKDAELRAKISKNLNVDTDSAGIVESLYKRIPTNARLLLENLAGVDTPITAEDFTKDELVEMVFLAEKQREVNAERERFFREQQQFDVYPEQKTKTKKRLQSFENTRGRTSVDPYKSVGNEPIVSGRKVDKGYLDSVISSFTDPRYGVATTLGKYTALDENGKISRIKDTYNFNKKQRSLPTDFIGAIKQIMISPELAGEYIANTLGTQDREVDIKLPRKMKEGGMAKRIAKQMELFEPVERGFDEGGLMDEGGTVDPVSGNDVPPGSTQEEVRDDIPAQLSEGEFVFPADVVRYIGLESLMRMRQEAKQGLAQMEAMGQMGNSEEATVEDNLPFDMYDLDIEEDEEYNMASGGVIKAANGTFTLPNTTGGYKAPDPVTTSYTQPLQPTQTFQPYTPQFTTATQTEGAFQPKTLDPVTPTFSEFIGQNIPGVDFEYVNYVNESGQIIRLRIDKATGELLDPIPEGYTLESEQVKSATTTPTLGQTSVRDEGDGGNGPTTGASIALGGKAVGPAIGGGIPGTRYAGPSRRVVGSTLYDVSFKNVGLGSMLNPSGFALNMIKEDGGLPENAIGVIGVKGNRKAVIELPSVAYNSLRNDPRGQQAKAVQEALAARDAITSGNKTSYVDGVLSVENKDGDMVAVGKDAVDLIGSTMYSELQDEAEGTFGFGKTDNLVDTAKDYFSGMSDVEKDNAQKALSAYNDQQFSDFVTEEDVSDYYSGKGTLGGKSYNDSPSDNNNAADSGPTPEPAAEGQFGDFNEGGLATQMKRSGLASKK